MRTKPAPDSHAKAGKILRATDEQWARWQRAANASTNGNLTAFLVNSADERAKVRFPE